MICDYCLVEIWMLNLNIYNFIYLFPWNKFQGQIWVMYTTCLCNSRLLNKVAMKKQKVMDEMPYRRRRTQINMGSVLTIMGGSGSRVLFSSRRVISSLTISVMMLITIRIRKKEWKNHPNHTSHLSIPISLVSSWKFIIYIVKYDSGRDFSAKECSKVRPYFPAMIWRMIHGSDYCNINIILQSTITMSSSYLQPTF